MTHDFRGEVGWSPLQSSYALWGDLLGYAVVSNLDVDGCVRAPLCLGEGELPDQDVTWF